MDENRARRVADALRDRGIDAHLETAEIERAKHKPTEDLDAYDYYMRGMWKFRQVSRSATQSRDPRGCRALVRRVQQRRNLRLWRRFRYAI